MTRNEKQLVNALDMMLQALEQAMPGVRHIACQNYKLLNEAPIAARMAIAAEQSADWNTDVRYVNDHGNVTVYGVDGSVLLELV